MLSDHWHYIIRPSHSFFLIKIYHFRGGPFDETFRSDKNPRRDPYAALRFRDFRLLLVGRFITSLGDQMLSFAIGWELWLRTRNELALGLVGLVQVIPIIVFSLPAGHVADQYNRKRIVMVTQSLLAMCALGLALLSYLEGPLVLIYLCLFGIGIGAGLQQPGHLDAAAADRAARHLHQRRHLEQQRLAAWPRSSARRWPGCVWRSCTTSP